MKFLVIKELGAKGEITPEWLAAMQEHMGNDPNALRKDYALLVKSIARLSVIETALRTQVLHEDSPSQDLTKLSREWLPMFGTTLNEVSSRVLNTASVLFDTALNGVLAKLLLKL